MSRKSTLSKSVPKNPLKAASPGTIGYVGKTRDERVALHLIDYDELNLTEKDVDSVAECLPFKGRPTVTWLNITGVHDTGIIEDVGKHFGIHPLVLEDIANTTQRPKMEEYEDYIYVVLKMAYADDAGKEIVLEQISLIVGKTYVISFQEKPGDVLEPLRNRIRNSKGRVRRNGSDYLAYAIIDAIIDHYFTILELVGEQIEDLEDRLISQPDQSTLNDIYRLKQELVFLRKSIWPTREVASSLQRSEHELIGQSVGVYFRDVYDHTIQVVETVETFRDMASGMLDLYLSTISNRMNEVMKVLTIFAAIFIPLTFAAGIYGMNFDYMPELHWRWGYFAALGVMASVAIIMIVYFKKRRWM